MNLIIVLLVISSLVACSSEPKDESKAHPAAYLTDVFSIDNGMPLRETQKKDFYFKKCELESRRPFQSKIEYSCNEP